MRLIDADYLKEQLQHVYEYPTATGAFDEFAVKIIPAIVDNVPTVGTEAVRYGHWEESCNELNKYCSECKKVCGTIYEHENYCPNCGAKMDGVEK